MTFLIRISFDETLESLEDLVTIESGVTEEFRLVPKDALPDDYEEIELSSDYCSTQDSFMALSKDCWDVSNNCSSDSDMCEFDRILRCDDVIGLMWCICNNICFNVFCTTGSVAV